MLFLVYYNRRYVYMGVLSLPQKACVHVYFLHICLTVCDVLEDCTVCIIDLSIRV